MEPTNSQNHTPDETTNTLPVGTEKALEVLLQLTKENTDTIIISADPAGKPIIHHTRNLYPVVRHTLLIVFILLGITLIIFLMHQNGKSIYDNGL